MGAEPWVHGGSADEVGYNVGSGNVGLEEGTDVEMPPSPFTLYIVYSPYLA